MKKDKKYFEALAESINDYDFDEWLKQPNYKKTPKNIDKWLMSLVDTKPKIIKLKPIYY
jgi:hypothetical protein